MSCVPSVNAYVASKVCHNHCVSDMKCPPSVNPNEASKTYHNHCVSDMKIEEVQAPPSYDNSGQGKIFY